MPKKKKRLLHNNDDDSKASVFLVGYVTLH